VVDTRKKTVATSVRFDMVSEVKDSSMKRKSRVGVFTTLGATSVFLGSLVFDACVTEYSLPATRCDNACSVVDRLLCPDDDPADCVATCEQGGLWWLSPRAGPCDPEEIAMLECLRETPSSAFTCLEVRGTMQWRDDVCQREQKALGRCRSPIVGAGITVCDAWTEACSASDAQTPGSIDGGPLGPNFCPVYSEHLCPEELSQLYDCLLQHPPDCAAGPMDAIACTPQRDRVSACNPDFIEQVCERRAWACAPVLGIDVNRYTEACVTLLRPPFVRERPCLAEHEAYASCLSMQPEECDPARLVASCASARAALDACTTSPADGGTAD
jgi:hypothetical protein